MQLTRNALLVLLGLSGSERLSHKERVIVETSAIFIVRQRGGLCQMRCRIGGNQEESWAAWKSGNGLCITSLNSHFAEI